MERKYKILTDETKEWYGRTLYRIQAVRNFGNIRKGDKGGWIENESNLSHLGLSWVNDEAKVFNKGNLFEDAQLFDNSQLFDDSDVFGTVHVYGKSEIHGHIAICGNAVIKQTFDYLVFKNTWSSGRYFVYTKSNKKWKVGCFIGTGEQLIEKAYKDSKLSGKMYEQYVRLVEKIENHKI